MLSDPEQRRLAEIESSLRADDPAFVHRFDTNPGHGGDGPSSPPSSSPWW